MIQTIIGRKIDQTQKFLENGRRVPVTEIEVSDNTVVQVKTLEKDKYTAVQLGFGTKKRFSQAVSGHAKKGGLSHVPAVLREVALKDVAEGDLPKVGDAIAVEAVFKPGDIVDVQGTSKGKGFAGVVKRHNFRGGPKTHGQSDRHRAPGSIGQTTTPGRVYKGKRMAGRMGHETVTLRNLTVVAVDAENDRIYVSGLVPGHKNAIVSLVLKGEDKKYVPLLKSQEELAKEEAEAKALADKQAAESSSAEATEDKSAEVSTEEKAEEPVVEEKTEEVKEEVSEAKTEEEVKPAEAPKEEKK